MSHTTEWIDWNGGDCPVAPDTLVEIKARDGYIARDRAAYFGSGESGPTDWWSHTEDRPGGRDDDIVAYRLLTEAA